MKAGVMEIVGETILDYMLQTGGTEKRITAVGIASWGFVANKKALVSPDVSAIYIYIYIYIYIPLKSMTFL
jgi:hypothetical protein